MKPHNRGQFAVDIPVLEREKPEIRRVQIEAMVKRALRALNDASGLSDDDPPWLWQLRLKGKEANSAELLAAVERAIQEEGSSPETFQRIAQVVGRPPVTDDEITEQIPKVEWWLLRNWLARDGAAFQCSFC